MELLIDVFPEEHPLSNCFLSPVVYRERTFKSVEHAYQAMKFYDGRAWNLETYRLKRILEARTGPEAKAIAYEYKDQMVITDQDAKVTLAYDIMYEKFKQNEELRKILLNTHPSTLIEEYPGEGASDHFWGIDRRGKGENVIGNILMQIREELLLES